jgi:hypothetical protein
MPDVPSDPESEPQLPGLEDRDDEPIDGGDRTAPQDDDAAPPDVTDPDAARRLQAG